MSRSAAQTYEAQNDDQLSKLFDKVKALVRARPAPACPARGTHADALLQRGVTNDIHDDAESQRTGLLADAVSGRCAACGQRLRSVWTASRSQSECASGGTRGTSLLADPACLRPRSARRALPRYKR